MRRAGCAWLTNNHRRDLGDLADVVIGLHDALDAGDGEVVLDGDAVGVWRQHRGAAGAVAQGRQRGHGERRVGSVVGVLHAFCAAHARRDVRGERRGGVRQRASVALVLGVDGLGVRVDGVGRSQIGRLGRPGVHWPGI